MKSLSLPGLSVPLALAVLMLAAVPDSGSGSELEPAALAVASTPDSVVVSGGHFAFTWSAARGGDLTSIRLHDGMDWHELVAPGPRRASVPGLLVYTPEGPLGPFTGGRITVEENAPGRVVVRSETRLATEKQKESPLAFQATYTIMAEGAVFVDLALTLPAEAKAIAVTRASLGWPVETQDFTLAFWHWQRNRDRGSGMLDPQPTFNAAYCPNLGLALGAAGSFSNQLQIILESGASFMGPEVPVVSSVRDGRSFITWILPEQQPPFALEPSFSYRNRLGFFLGRHPWHSRLTGHRLVHWLEEEGDGMAYPSTSAIEAMALAGATGLVLGPGWLARGGSAGHVPADDAEFRRTIADAHARELLCLATVLAAGDGDEIGRWARGLGLDGLLITHASAHYQAFATPGTDFPARASFEWMQALRGALGPEAIFISHSGLEVPDLSFGLLADGIAFGLERADWRAARSTLANSYLGGAGYAVPCPLTLREPMQTTRAMAIAAATASVPLIPAGFLAGRTVTTARYAMALWQLLRLVPPGPAAEVRTTGIGAVSASSNVNFWSAVYRMSDDVGLLVTANLSPEDQDSTAVWVDFPALGFSGEYDVELIVADTIEDFTVRHLGRSANGRFRTDSMARNGVRGILFVRGDMPSWAAEGLDRGLKTASMFFDGRAPATVTDLTVSPASGGLALAWAAATDNQHVAAYRIYRSRSPGFEHADEIQILGDVYEETRYRDLDVAPGETFGYAVSALDVKGNEGLPSVAVTGTAAAGKVNLAFNDATAAARFVVLSGAWTIDDSTYGFGCRPDPTALARSVLADIDLPDVDMSATIDGGGGGSYAGGLACRADQRGNSIALLLGGTNHDEVTLARIENETVTPLASAYYPYLRPGRTRHALRLRATGAEITGFVDDRAVVRATTSADPAGGSGGVGFVARRGHVHFDNLMVSPAAGVP